MGLLDRELDKSEKVDKGLIAGNEEHSFDNTRYTKDHSKDSLSVPTPNLELNVPSNFVSFRFDKSWKNVEQEFIEFVLAKFYGNRTNAAKSLGINVRTLQRKLLIWGK